MKTGLLQYSPVWEDKNSNMNKITEMVKSSDKMDLLILPELTLTGFTMKSANFAEELNGETFQFFSGLCQENKFHLFGGLIEQEGTKHYNSLLHINPQGVLAACYRKIHPFTFSTEDKFYAEGKETVITDVNGWSTGLSICYDLRFPELYRFYGKQKCELMVNIANWPVTRIEHWRTLLKARAIENQCYVAAVNRVGDDPKLHYNGFSSVFDPMGNELISSKDEEKIVVANLIFNSVKEVRDNFPFLNDIKLI